MLRRIEVRNFRGFATMTADLRDVTVVLGPNSSGKTTLLHAVRVALQLTETALGWGSPKVNREGEEPEIALTYDGVIRDHTEILPLTDWRALFFNQAADEFEIRLHFDKGDAIEIIRVGLRCGSNEQLKLWVQVRSPQALEQIEGLKNQSKFVAPRLTEFLTQHLPLAVFIPSFYGVVREEQYRAQAVVARMLGAGDQSHIVRNLVARLSNDAFDRLNAFLQEALGVEIVRRTSMAEADNTLSLDVSFRDDNGTLELSAAGAGLVNLIALYSSLERFGGQSRTRKIIYLLDEPEAHLHPRLQGEMAHHVSTLIVKQFGAQVILATHAVEIVNRLAGRDDATLLRVDRGSKVATVLRGQPEIVAELESWANMAPFSAINFLASRKVIFHEGPTDAVVIKLCAALRFRNDMGRRDRFDAWTFAELGGTSRQDMAKMLERLVDQVTDSDARHADAFVVLTVLDRDHEREPGWSDVSATETATSRRLVWSRHSLESLFLTVPILGAWLRAWMGDATPPDLDEVIADALKRANDVSTLNDKAEEQLLAKLLARGLSDDQGRPLGKDKLAVRAIRMAREMVENDPQTWQRGKDRARFVLGTIKERLPKSHRNRLTTDLPKLLQRVDLSRFGTVEGPIPAEIRDMLEWMTRPSVDLQP